MFSDRCPVRRKFFDGLELGRHRSSNIEMKEALRMFEGLFQPMHMLVVFGIALLVFGPKKLPELGKGLGESIRGFKSAMAAKDAVPEPETPAAEKRAVTAELES